MFIFFSENHNNHTRTLDQKCFHTTEKNLFTKNLHLYFSLQAHNIINFKNYHSYLLDDQNRIWTINKKPNSPIKSNHFLWLKKVTLLIFYILLGTFIYKITISTFIHFLRHTCIW